MRRLVVIAAALCMLALCMLGVAPQQAVAASTGGGTSGTTSPSQTPVRASGTLSWSGSTWHIKDGTGKLGQHWSASHVSVNGGVLTVRDYGGVGGGVTQTTPRTYGTYSVRYRWSCGSGAKYAILLWPSNGSRPEIDLAEQEKSDASTCRQVMATWHPKPGCTACVQMRTTGNFTSWNTVTLQWTPSGLTFLLNGRVFGHVSATSHVSMHLAIQTDVYAGGTGTLQVSSAG